SGNVFCAATPIGLLSAPEYLRLNRNSRPHKQTTRLLRPVYLSAIERHHINTKLVCLEGQIVCCLTGICMEVERKWICVFLALNTYSFYYTCYIFERLDSSDLVIHKPNT